MNDDKMRVKLRLGLGCWVSLFFFCVFLCFWFVWILDAPTFCLIAFQEQQALYAQDFAESQDFELNSLPSP